MSTLRIEMSMLHFSHLQINPNQAILYAHKELIVGNYVDYVAQIPFMMIFMCVTFAGWTEIFAIRIDNIHLMRDCML